MKNISIKDMRVANRNKSKNTDFSRKKALESAKSGPNILRNGGKLVYPILVLPKLQNELA